MREARVTIPECYELMAYCEQAMLEHTISRGVFDNLRAVNMAAYSLILEDKAQHEAGMTAFWDSYTPE
jgi:hypothetical protein